jgi:endonuclease YncB( thermonuclease family)
VDVVDVIDGDTVEVHMPWHDAAVLQWRVRLLGINAPELRRGDEDSKAMGARCRDMLTERIKGRKAILVCAPDKDSFGRLVGTLYQPTFATVDQLVYLLSDTTAAERVSSVLPLCDNLNEWLLKEGPGVVPYKD